MTNGTQDVTMAVLATKMDAMHVDLQVYCQKHYALEKRVRDVEERSSRTEERVKLLAVLQTSLALIASTIAGWLGTRS